MGAQIAAHFANAGFPVQLLDVTAAAAREGLERAKALRPDPFFTAHAVRLVSTGGLDEDLGVLASADWVVEAIVEQLDAKQALLSRVESAVASHAIVSSNTSGLPLSAMAEGRSDHFRRRWLGTHFFNPPRYLHLLEVIPGPETLPEAVELVLRCADRRLGKGVVLAKDTPGFIANHLGLFGLGRTFAALSSGGYTIDEIDAVTGPPIGRPKSATFRTADIVGIDVLAAVMRDLSGRLESPEARTSFTLPPLVSALLERGWTGTKAGQGFYRRVGDVIHTLDPETMTYGPAERVHLPSLDTARSIEATGDRLRALFLGSDRVGRLLRQTLGDLLVYAARVTPDIAHSIDDVDRAMRWGFGWELGPFETWDAIGIKDVLTACDVPDPPPLVAEALARGAFRPVTPATAPRSAARPSRVPPAAADLEILYVSRERGGVVRGNSACSLVDIGEDVLAVEFHSKMNAIGGDAIAMLQAGVREAETNFRALVVGNEAVNFSAGANLLLLLLEAQEGNWDEVDLMVRSFQRATMSLKYADVPVVVAPAGLALGGGCEICLHADRIFAAAETYIGLAETGVGLIPAGGGTKEMLVRAMQACRDKEDPLPHVQGVFETIALARVSTSAEDARRYGYLRQVDEVTMNRQRLIAGARAVALARAADYVKPQPPASIRVGGEGVQAALKLGVYLASRAGRITDHDALIGRKLASVLSGGDRAHAGTLTEQDLLDLERAAFLSLCGERRTQERIAHTLKTGKPLRN
jgi:3-hydroxyacyl-CoA dehydrogenase